MKYKKQLISTLVLLGIGISCIYAQSNTVSSGGIAIGSGGNISYSVGQMFYANNTGTTGSVAQGVQQAYEIRTLSNEDITAILLKFIIFPNPTQNHIVLKIENFPPQDFYYQLYNILGKLFINQKVLDSETKIEMDKLPSSIYLLKVFRNNREVKAFKIIKN
jgi:hypothetical protein